MSEFLEWRHEWTLDIGQMDEDHRILAEMLNRIANSYGYAHTRKRAEAGVEPPSQASLLALLDDFGRHVRKHFLREETFMRDISYPYLTSHKGEHDLLMAEYAELMRKIQATGTEYLDPHTLKMLKDWLIGHVLESDRQLAAFYHEVCAVEKSEAY
jgi:hemerythrin